MTTSTQLREAIARHLEYQSNWRAQKAEEHAEDDRKLLERIDRATVVSWMNEPA
jgi:hypothetical protein